MRSVVSCWTLLFVGAVFSWGGDDGPATTKPAGVKAIPIDRVLPFENSPTDVRLSKFRTLNDKYHPWEPAKDLNGYNAWFQRTRTRLLVGLGLWPLPPKTPLNPVIHGLIDKGEYTIQKVYFESMPGHYVTGNLYRPKGKPGKLPAILNPHGHWQDGRMYDAGEAAALAEIKGGGEKFLMNARYPMQAIPVGLVRLGCIVFMYDMVGYADSKAVGHNDRAFTSPEAIGRLQSIFGLQTWNSIRALDFLETLPDVDRTRIGVTGASGGGTQTFMLGAIDDRPAVAFPAVMVSTGMQGGCICENAPLIRVGSSNVEIAAMFAPRPLGMTGADDWTKEIETKGLPELKRHYALFRSENNVMAKCFPQFKHNYNQVSRELMFSWFNRHFALGATDTNERPIDPVPPAQLSVFDKEHPRPANEANGATLANTWRKQSELDIKALDEPAKLRTLATCLGEATFQFDRKQMFHESGSVRNENSVMERWRIAPQRSRLAEYGPGIPAAYFRRQVFSASSNVIWINDRGHREMVEPVIDGPSRRLTELLEGSLGVLVTHIYGTGDAAIHPSPPTKRSRSDSSYAGYRLCYNDPFLSHQVRDILITNEVSSQSLVPQRLQYVGVRHGGPLLAVAAAYFPKPAARVVIDLNGFEFDQIANNENDMLLPGALKYGGIATFLANCKADELVLLNWEHLSAQTIASLKERWNKVDANRRLTFAGKTNDTARAAVAWVLKPL